MFTMDRDNVVDIDERAKEPGPWTSIYLLVWPDDLIMLER